ncbi:hypothetical protein SLH52_22930 [Cytobacillus sp. IB215665]|nr:hypothetical protein [Cytobacillus sp. IB215665]MDX8368024.1 hypothetical protein [Cytobacillus sp. IB215665]
MKKVIFSLLGSTIILGATVSYAFAHSNEESNDNINFGQMKPYIQEMHPEWSTLEQKEMFESCHGESGTIENYNEDMMNNF